MMSSSIVPIQYPERRFPVGNLPKPKRSMHHNCKLGDFEGLLKAVDEEVYNEVMNTSTVGVILILAKLKFIWAAGTVHHFLVNQLQCDRLYELWSLIGGRPVRFSLHEFEEVTKLNCEEIPVNGDWDVNHTTFWEEMGVPTGDGPNWYELVKVFDICRTWSKEKRKRVALLFILHVGIYGISRDSRIPLMAAKKVMDLEVFEKYPWGRVSFDEMMKSIQVIDFNNDSYTIHGCGHALLVWMYEAIPILGEKLGRRREEAIPFLCWHSSRARYTFDTLYKEEKESRANKKVRVRHLVVKPLEEIYPPWNDKEDKKLDNMIRDILGGCLDETFWNSVSSVSANKKRKAKAKVVVDAESEDDFVEKPIVNKNKKKKKAFEEDKKEHLKRKKSLDMSSHTSSEKETNDVDMTTRLKDFVNEKKKMNRTESCSGEGKGSKNKAEETGEMLMLLKKMMTKIDSVDSRLTSLEGKRGKEREDVIDPLVDELSKVGGDGDASGEKDLSWMVEQQGTSQAKRVIRNPKVTSKIMRKVKCEPNAPTEKGEATNLFKPPSVKKNMSNTGGAEKKLRTECVSISDEITPPRSKAYHLSSLSSDSDQLDKAVNKALGIALEQILKLAQPVVIPVPVAKGRNKTLAKTQVSPFVGYSGTARIMSGVTPSHAIYDPFAKVDEHKVNRLTQYVQKDLDNPFETSLAGVEFYMVLMTPKEVWPEGSNYGWLQTPQMEAVLNMFRRRSLQRPTPFKSERIAFIDPCFSGQWCSDYKRDFVPGEKDWVFPNGYFNMYNGLTPTYAVTKKKWVEDVDTLYIAHNINDAHWVAVVVDLVGKRVKVYDSIVSHCTDNQVFDSCKPYTKMIPLLIKQAAPPEKRQRMKETAFSIYRVRIGSVPQNNQTGDCGVYTLKFIECLALGHAMDGLCDANMAAIRLKLAAEVMDETPHEDIVQVSDPNPRGRWDDKVPLQTDSTK